MIKKLFWRTKFFFERLILNERFLSILRDLFGFTFTFILVLLGYYLFEDVDTSAVVDEWVERNPFNYLDFLIVWIIRLGNFVVFSFRHTIIPLGMFVGVLLVSAFYVQDVYELPKFTLALRYIFSSFTGIGYPRLMIEDGEKKISKKDINLIDTIGGPGVVIIRPGNVVLFESLRSPSSVRSNPFNLISRFESIKENIGLNDHHGYIKELFSARTKDGIDLVVRDVHFRYRLRTGKRFGDYEKRGADEPYPYSVEAVKKMAYNRSVGSKGLSSWHGTIQFRIDGDITNYIKSHTFDHLTAPTYEDKDPRKIISDQILKGGLRSVLRNVGAELLWLDIGHFEVAEEIIETVADQRIDTWGARWDGEAMIVRAHGEARKMAYQEMGRAEGQADMLLSILQALDEVGYEIGRDQEEQRLDSLRRIIWARVAQIFDVVAEEEKKNNLGRLLPSQSK